MGVQRLGDEHFPTHGNWMGLSLGGVTVVWLTPSLSHADHRLHHVAPWADQPCQTWRRGTGQHVHPLAVSDDRLAAVLEALSDADRWSACEGPLTRQLLRVYDLEPARVRRDSTTASGYGAGTEDGRFPFGHRTDHRPDLPPVKVRLSALDPLGLPVATDGVPGPRADDPWSVPAMTRVRKSLGRQGWLDVGDGKMGALEPRAFIQAGGDSYLCPLSEIQLPPDVLEGYWAAVWREQQPLPRLTRMTAGGKREHLADGDERLEPLTVMAAGEAMAWTARRLVVRSRPLARAGEAALRARLAKAQAAGAARNDRGRGKKRFPALTALQAAVEAIRIRHRVQGRLAVRDTDGVQERPRRRDGHRPATVRVARDLRVTAVVDRRAVAGAVRRLGGRVSAPNAPADQLSLGQAVLAYRRESLMERDMGRLKGQPLSLTPRYLERDDHATGLSRLLWVGLRVLTRLECVGRRRVAAARIVLAGRYAGNPTRATARPTAERLLEAFRGLTLTIIREGRHRRYHLTPFSRVHRRILVRLDVPLVISTRLCPDSHKPPSK
jgi:transposase